MAAQYYNNIPQNENGKKIHCNNNNNNNKQKTLVRTCTKLSSNKSTRQGDYTVEPASASGQNYPQ